MRRSSSRLGGGVRLLLVAALFGLGAVAVALALALGGKSPPRPGAAAAAQTQFPTSPLGVGPRLAGENRDATGRRIADMAAAKANGMIRPGPAADSSGAQRRVLDPSPAWAGSMNDVPGGTADGVHQKTVAPSEQAQAIQGLMKQAE